MQAGPRLGLKTHKPFNELNPTGVDDPLTGELALELELEPPKYLRPTLKRRPPMERFEAMYCSRRINFVAPHQRVSEAGEDQPARFLQ